VTYIGVADAQNVYLYESESNTYRKLKLAEYPRSALPASVYLGPVDVNALVQDWQGQGLTVQSGGNSRQLGRDAAVIEYAPTWRASGSAGASSGGVGRIWVDDETGLVTRNLVDNGPAQEYVDAQVTKLDLEPQLGRALFRFEPPAGAQQVSD
jgi:outer membrane lipoprotein-sorting protein